MISDPDINGFIFASATMDFLLISSVISSYNGLLRVSLIGITTKPPKIANIPKTTITNLGLAIKFLMIGLVTLPKVPPEEINPRAVDLTTVGNNSET